MKDIELQNDTLCWLLEVGISAEGKWGQGLSKMESWVLDFPPSR